MLKAGGPTMVTWLTMLFQSCWSKGTLPDDWKKGIILPVHKGKGSRRDCKNYRGITLLSCPGKLFAHILLERIKSRLVATRRKEQSGFTPHRSTIDRICALNFILQCRREYQRPLWIAYVDLKSAFDSVDRNALWLLLRSLGIPLKIVSLIRELYTDTLSCVRMDGTLSDWFPIKSGVRQGCTIAPSLFLTPMDWLLERTVHRGFSGASLGDESFTDLDYADDVALLAEMLEVLILSLEIMQDEAKPFGLEINWSKTKIQTTVDTFAPQSVQVAGNTVEITKSFTYLGSRIDWSGRCEVELGRRISITRDCMTQLDRNIWHSSISVSTKIRLYCAYILPVLLYGAETWTMTKAMSDKVDAFDQWCLRRILRIDYRKHVTNAEVRGRTGCPPVSEVIRSRRLRLFGHIARAHQEMDHCRALRAVINRPPRDWKRRPGRPTHTWTRTVETDLKPSNLGLSSAWHRAQDRDSWRRLVQTAMPQFGVRS